MVTVFKLETLPLEAYSSFDLTGRSEAHKRRLLTEIDKYCSDFGKTNIPRHSVLDTESRGIQTATEGGVPIRAIGYRPCGQCKVL